MKNLLKSMTQGSQRAERFHEKQSAPPKPMNTTEATKRPAQTNLEAVLALYARTNNVAKNTLNGAKEELAALNAIATAAQAIEEDKASLTSDRGNETEAEKRRNDMFYKSQIHLNEARLSDALENLNSIRS